MVTDLPIVPATAADDDAPSGPTRRATRRSAVGPVPVGGGAPISVQTMTVTPTHQVDETLQAIAMVQAAGADLVRVAVP
ncbi:4-hydroxy-3-methylbut-2-en-1-yl diphosphate synthase, partial [Enterococcus hirae]